MSSLSIKDLMIEATIVREVRGDKDVEAGALVLAMAKKGSRKQLVRKANETINKKWRGIDGSRPDETTGLD